MRQSFRKSRFQQAWSAGRYVYRWSAMMYSAVQLYQNPWLWQLVATGVFQLSRVAIRAVF